MPIIQTARLKMYCEVHGEGEPLLVIRGLGSTCDGFKAQVEGLSPYFRITHPTLVITGTEDTLVDPGNSRLIASSIPGARLIEFQETGHVFFTEKAEEVNHTLVGFF